MNLVKIYRCLCDETRLRILHLLSQGPLCVCHFQEILQIPQVAVSKHLAYLRKTGMVEARRHEQWMIYSLPPCPGLKLDLQLRCLQDCVQTEPVFRSDLRRLKALGPVHSWIPKVLNGTGGKPGCRPVQCPVTVSRSRATPVAVRKKNKKLIMKKSIAIGLISATLGFSSLAADNPQNSPSNPASQPVPGKGSAALQQAASANKYLFAFFYEKDDEATRSVRQKLEAALKGVTPPAELVAIDRGASGEKDLVAKYGVGQAPMPLVLAIAPNGAVTGGIKGSDLSETRVRDAVASTGLQQCLKGLQDRKVVFVCLQNGETKENEAAMKGVNEFKADAQLGANAEIVKVNPSDANEAKLLAQLKADPQAKTAATAVLAPPGMLVTKVEGATTKADLEAALKKAASACAPGSSCGPSGCGPAPK